MSEIAVHRESRIGFLFLIVLLLLAGVSASVVGYKVKTADIERKQSLQETYLAVGGVTDKPLIAGIPEGNAPLSDQQVLILVYEMNQHIRGFGLAKLLTSVPKERWKSVEDAYDRAGASEATVILRDALDSFYSSKEVSPADVNLPAEVNKKARLYSSRVARYVEANLFKFAVEKKLTKSPLPS